MSWIQKFQTETSLTFLTFSVTVIYCAIIRDPTVVVPEPRRCIVKDSRNSSGICKPVTACPAVLGLLRAGINPTACSSEGLAIICCPIHKRISYRKCQEFSDVLRKPLKAKGALVYDGGYHQRNDEDTSMKCEAFLETHISGGRKAKAREYPYQAALGYGADSKPDWRCGATLIDPQFLLTAAHCAFTTFGPPKVALLGDRRLATKKDDTRIIANISDVYVHPEYKPPLQYHDIAILKLQSPLVISRGVLPACLPDPEDRLDRKRSVEATGWGQTGAFEGQSDILKSVLLLKDDIHECTAFFQADEGSRKRLPDGIIKSQFCAGDKMGMGMGDTCKGDSGGPLTVTSENASCTHFVVGITSFGSNYCGYQQPGVYTNVLSYLDWIEDLVWYNTSSTRSLTLRRPSDSLVLNALIKTEDPTASRASGKQDSSIAHPTPTTIKPETSNTVLQTTTLQTTPSTKLTPPTNTPLILTAPTSTPLVLVAPTSTPLAISPISSTMPELQKANTSLDAVFKMSSSINEIISDISKF